MAEVSCSGLVGTVLIGIALLTWLMFSIIHNIKNYNYNCIMGKRYSLQTFDSKRMDDCPKCKGHFTLGPPMVIRNEWGGDSSIISKEYIEHEFECDECDWKQNVVLKWDGYCWPIIGEEEK